MYVVLYIKLSAMMLLWNREIQILDEAYLILLSAFC